MRKLKPVTRKEKRRMNANTDLNQSGAEMRKAFNDFYHPQAHNNTPISSHEVEFQMQLGSKMYPEYPIRSAQEAFTQLQKCLGIQDSAFTGIEIQPYKC
jgi:DNA polymerase III alpha subunit